jgi:hypothetical protein
MADPKDWTIIYSRAASNLVKTDLKTGEIVNTLPNVFSLFVPTRVY